MSSNVFIFVVDESVQGKSWQGTYLPQLGDTLTLATHRRIVDSNHHRLLLLSIGHDVEWVHLNGYLPAYDTSANLADFDDRSLDRGQN